MTLAGASTRFGLTLSFGLALPGAQLGGQTVVTGTVREDSTGRPLAGVDVLIERSEQRAVSNEAGRYVLGRLPPGNYLLLFRSVGFRPVRLALRIVGGDTAWANALLIPSALPLPPIEVAARPSEPRGLGKEGFEERRRLGFGKFIDSAVLRRSEHRRLSDVLQGIPGIRMTRVTTNGFVGLWAESTRKPGPSFRNCWMQVVVDGTVLYFSGNDIRDPPDFRNDWFVSNIEAVEVYRSAAETPIEFGGTGAACGTIVLWTRRG